MYPLNTFLNYIFTAILILIVSVSSAFAQEVTANLQIIHNSPDPLVSSVDIFVNGDEYLTGFDFRDATEFVEVPAGVELEIQIAPVNSGIENAVGPFAFTLDADVNYLLVASGVVDEDAYPDAAGFSLEVFANAILQADDPETVAANVHHGSPDAPAVDLYLNQTGDDPAVENLAYPEFTGYISLVPEDEVVGFAPAGGMVMAEIDLPLADFDLAGSALTVLASGFFNENNTNENNSFGALAVLANGTSIFMPVMDGDDQDETANVQIIHNSPDPVAASVDIYINGMAALTGVDFRTATDFLELPGGTPINIIVTPAGADIEDGVEFEGVEFVSGENYYVIATGVLDPAAFAENPDGVDTEFFLDIISGASLSAEEGNFEFVLYHGASDAPAVDIEARNVAPLAEGISYTDVSPEYISVPADNYIIDVFAAGGDTPIVSFDADVSALGGTTGIVLASGFLDPSANNDGPAFGVIVVLPDGTVVELGIATSTDNIASDIPNRVELNQNFPNPFNPTTNISYALPEASDVKFDIFSVTGQHVATLVDSRQSAGQHSINFDASALSSGVYLYRIQADNYSLTRRMTLIK